MRTNGTAPEVIQGSRLARNAAWNLSAHLLPLGIALAVVPLLIQQLGVERFGLLTLIWLVIGYFSLFDLGLARALTKLVAERLGRRDEAGVPRLFWSALPPLLILGLSGAAAMAGAAPWLTRWLEIPPALEPEAARSFSLLAFSVPVVVLSAGFQAVLMAYQRFGSLAAIRLPLSVYSLAAPLVVLGQLDDLAAVVLALLAGRLLGALLLLWQCLRLLPGPARLGRRELGSLLRTGGWMSVSSAVGPLMALAERLLLGAWVSLAAVAYYATPYDLVSKLWILPSALMGVLFPALASVLAEDPARAGRLFGRAVSGVFIVLFPPVLVLVAFSRELLELWLDASFAEASAGVLALLAAGGLANGLGRLPFSLLQGAGRADVTARLHLLELPAYALLLLLLIPRLGVEGVALAWAMRAGADALVLHGLAYRLVPSSRAGVCRGLMLLGLGATALAAVASLEVLWPRVLLAAALAALTLAAGWRLLFDEDGRTRARRLLGGTT